MADFNYEIVESIAVLSTKNNTSLELNLVSFADNEPKYDLRMWNRAAGYEPRLLKGVCMTEEQILALRDVLNEYFK